MRLLINTYKKGKDIEIRIKRLMVIYAANMGDYTKEINNMTMAKINQVG